MQTVVPKQPEGRRRVTTEHKNLVATVRPVVSSEPNGEFEAIISTEAVDRDGEVIKAGAFNPLPASIPVFSDHDWLKGVPPVARAVPYYDGNVLKADGVFASTARAQEMRALVSEGVVDAMSVGFINPKKSTVRGQRTVTAGELIEVSFTAIPVNTGARILAAKSRATALSRSERDELWLRAKKIEIEALLLLKGIDPDCPWSGDVAAAIRQVTGKDVAAELHLIRGGRR